MASDRELFLALLADHEAQLMGFLCAISPNHQDAEDLLQQTVLTMWQKFPDFDPGTSFIAWGCRIARYKAMNLMQARRVTPLANDVLELLLIAQSEQEPEQRQARRRALAGCLKKLPEKDRTLIELAYTNGQTIKELAESIGRSTGGVYNSLARIRGLLFGCIQAALATEGHS